MKDFKIAPEDSFFWKCNWLECSGGGGLAGSGMCSFRGDWSDLNCPKYISNDDYEKREYERYKRDTPLWKRTWRKVEFWFKMTLSLNRWRIRRAFERSFGGKS